MEIKNAHWILLGLVLVGLAAYMMRPFVDVFVYSIFVYYLARPWYRKFLKKIKSERISALTSLIIVVLPTVILLVYTLGVASLELRNLLVGVKTPLVDEINKMVYGMSMATKDIEPVDLLKLFEEHRNIGEYMVSVMSGAVGVLIRDVISSAFGILFKLFLIFMIAYYLLKDGSRLRKWVTESLLGGGKDLHNRFFDEVDLGMHQIFYGNILMAAQTAMIGAALFTILNFVSNTLLIPYPVLLGLLCGVASLIPVAGVAIVWAPLTAYLITQAIVTGMLHEKAGFLAVYFASTVLLVDLIPNLILRPRFTSQRTHKGLMMLSYILGPIAFGMPGILIGPIIVVATTGFMRIILPEIRKRG